jgi:hypothetical protein
MHSENSVDFEERNEDFWGDRRKYSYIGEDYEVARKR